MGSINILFPRLICGDPIIGVGTEYLFLKTRTFNAHIAFIALPDKGTMNKTD